MAFTTMGYVVMQAQQRRRAVLATGRLCGRKQGATAINSARHAATGANMCLIRSEVEPSRQYVVRVIYSSPPVADYWVSFARDAGHRDNLHGPTHWPACRKGRDVLLRIGVNKHAGFKLENLLYARPHDLFKRVMSTTLTSIKQTGAKRGRAVFRARRFSTSRTSSWRFF